VIYNEREIVSFEEVLNLSRYFYRGNVRREIGQKLRYNLHYHNIICVLPCELPETQVHYWKDMYDVDIELPKYDLFIRIGNKLYRFPETIFKNFYKVRIV